MDAPEGTDRGRRDDESADGSSAPRPDAFADAPGDDAHGPTDADDAGGAAAGAGVGLGIAAAGGIAATTAPSGGSAGTAPAAGGEIGALVGDGVRGSGGVVGEHLGAAMGRSGKAGGEVDAAGTSAGTSAGETGGGTVRWRGAKGDARRAGRLGGTARSGRLRGGKGVVAAGVGVAAVVVVIGALVTAATAGGGGGGGTDVAMVPVGDATGGTPTSGSGDGSGGDGSGYGPPRPPFTKLDSPSTTIADDAATDPGVEPGGDPDPVVVSDPASGADPAPTPDPSGDPTPDPAPDPPADTTPPSIGGLTASPARIIEGGSGEFCSRSVPATTTLSATVSDASGVQGVAVAWQGAGLSGSTSMSPSGSTWTAAVTPGPSGTLYAPNTASITWRVTAHDAAGNATENKSTFTLIGC